MQAGYYSTKIMKDYETWVGQVPDTPGMTLKLKL